MVAQVLAYLSVRWFSADIRLDIPAGHHRYPFKFQLPYNIPSSFEHHYGYVRYTVKGVIDRPWRFDHECKAAFTIISILDLNAHQIRCVRCALLVTRMSCECIFIDCL